MKFSDFNSLNEDRNTRSEYAANRHMSGAHSDHDHEHERREKANAASRAALQKLKASKTTAKKSPLNKLKKMFTFEEYLSEVTSRETHQKMAAEAQAKAERLKKNLQTSSPEYKSAMASYHYHMMQITSGSEQGEHKKNYVTHSRN